MTTSNWATDNRYGANNSGATAPANAPAAYAARWIDMGDHVPADVVPDRQGLAYSLPDDRDNLIAAMEVCGTKFRSPAHMGMERDETTVLMDTVYWQCRARRSGGYIYVDAWLTPAIPNPPAADVETCAHCGRSIVLEDSTWVDPEATGDDVMWRETCDAHDTFTAEHEPVEDGPSATDEDELEPPYGTQTACRDCGLDIEYHGSAQWLDRGGNWSCGDRDHHVPMVNWGLSEPKAHAFDFEVVDGPVSYHPWTNGYAIGFEVHRSDGRIEFIYLNPSQSDGDEAEANVFLYTGTEGDPAADEAHHHYLVDES